MGSQQLGRTRNGNGSTTWLSDRTSTGQQLGSQGLITVADLNVVAI